MTKFEKIILASLVQDREYFRKVLPFLKSDYFEERVPNVLFSSISDYADKYGSAPSESTLEALVEAKKGLSEEEFSEIKDLVKEVSTMKIETDRDWRIEESEAFCKKQALFNAIYEAVSIIDGSDKKKRDVGILPNILSDALAVSFDHTIGHDYFASIESRWEYYTQKETKFPSLLTLLDKAMNGGVMKKTLNIIMAVSGGGKSAVMCSLAASYLRQGYNVLYITLELAEERVAERIDANMLNVSIQQVKEFPKDLFCKKLTAIKEKTEGRLKIKEYPTQTASVTHFKILLEELKIKEGFKPDIVFVDYLGITASAHYKAGSSANSYTVQKSVAEELRGFAVEQELIVWSAVQANRSGYNNSDMSETSIAESIGILMTADFVLGVIRTPELDELGHCIFKQIKSRYGDVSYLNRFIVGFDRAKMRCFDIEDQDGLIKSVDETPDEQVMNKIAQSEDIKKSSKPSLVASSGWDFDE